MENPPQQRLDAILVWTGTLLLSIVLNIVLFSIIPSLISSVPGKRHSIESIQRVNVSRIHRREPPPFQKPIHKPSEPLIPKEASVSKVSSLKKSVKIEPFLRMPEIPFEINPQLPFDSGGLPSPSIELVSIGPPSEEGYRAPGGSGEEKGYGGLYEIGEIDGPLTPLAQAPPVYPLRARRMGTEGWVKINFIVTEKGTVSQITIVEALPKNTFEESVIRSVSSWRFSPGTVGGIPVKTRVKTTIKFELD
jgi:protein TonB